MMKTTEMRLTVYGATGRTTPKPETVKPLLPMGVEDDEIQVNAGDDPRNDSNLYPHEVYREFERKQSKKDASKSKPRNKDVAGMFPAGVK